MNNMKKDSDTLKKKGIQLMILESLLDASKLIFLIQSKFLVVPSTLYFIGVIAIRSRLVNTIQQFTLVTCKKIHVNFFSM